MRHILDRKIIHLFNTDVSNNNTANNDILGKGVLPPHDNAPIHISQVHKKWCGVTVP